MSTQQLEQRDQRETYRRDNYYAGDDQYDDDQLPGGHHELPGTNKHRWVAKSVLRDGATFLDPLLLDAENQEWGDVCPVDAGKEMELTAAKHFVVADETPEGLAAYGHPKRCNPKYGHLVGGGSIQDRPFGQFRQCVESWLGFLIESHGLTHRDVETLQQKACWMKRHDPRDWPDVHIVAELSRAVDHAGSIESYFE